MNKYLRVYAVVEKGDDVLCGNPEFYGGHIYTRTEMTIKVKEDNTVVKDSELYDHFSRFLDLTLEGLEDNNE